jgi:uncharacterized protein (UPF0332 family)
MNQEDAKSLVKYRMEQAEAAIKDAEVLLTGDGTVGSIINRSYYAMFYAALAALQTVGKAPSKHAGVLSLFNREFVLTGNMSRELGRSIHRAFELRQSADYAIMPQLGEDAAVAACEEARKFIAGVRAYLEQQGWMA